MAGGWAGFCVQSTCCFVSVGNGKFGQNVDVVLFYPCKRCLFKIKRNCVSFDWLVGYVVVWLGYVFEVFSSVVISCYVAVWLLGLGHCFYLSWGMGGGGGGMGVVSSSAGGWVGVGVKWDIVSTSAGGWVGVGVDVGWGLFLAQLEDGWGWG